MLQVEFGNPVEVELGGRGANLDRGVRARVAVHRHIPLGNDGVHQFFGPAPIDAHPMDDGPDLRRDQAGALARPQIRGLRELVRRLFRKAVSRDHRARFRKVRWLAGTGIIEVP